MDSPRGLQPFQPSRLASVTTGKPHPASEAARAKSSARVIENIAVRRDIFDRQGKKLIADKEDDDAPEAGTAQQTNGTRTGEIATKTADDLAKEPKKATYCWMCGQDCSRSFFHKDTPGPVQKAGGATSTANYDLCPLCYKEGRHTKNGQTGNFVRIDDPNYTRLPDRDAPWSDKEVLYLLEALDVHDDDWNAISDYVGTRSREECVMKFLQLEIEDRYLEEGGESKPSLLTNSLNYGRVPFSNFENPIVSLIGYAAAMSDPAVTAAAAGRTAQETVNSLRRKLESGPNGTPAEPAAARPSQAGDSMDVDVPSGAAKVEAPPSDDGAAFPPTTVALAAAAGRTQALSSHQERELSRQSAAAINSSLNKTDCRVRHFAHLERSLDAERLAVEYGQQQLFCDRLGQRRRTKALQDQLRKVIAQLGAAGPAGASAQGTLASMVAGLDVSAGGGKLTFDSLNGSSMDTENKASSDAGQDGLGGHEV